ncbi:hypothetical protein [Streptomyces venezuelae]|uniref:hypothetical protein n=1 Tax=Streptomyces venezuelae TaxID=54571 RepID=UPI00364CCA74
MSDDLDRWATLFVLSGRDDEPAASAESPTLSDLEAQAQAQVQVEAQAEVVAAADADVSALRECGSLSELIDVRRRISVRHVLRQGDHPYRFEERLTPHFDEGVALARRLPSDSVRLARALTDRSMFRVATGAFESAHVDFAEAVEVLDMR